VDRLILVRHAETAHSAEGLMNPDPPVDAPLSEAGERAARELGGLLDAEPIDLAVTSPRLRARRTAELLLAGRDVPRLELEELAEIRAGAFAGGPAEAFRRWVREHPVDAVPPGGESVLAAGGRYLTGLRRIEARSDPVVLAVLHNLPMRMALNAASGADPVAGPVQRLPPSGRRDMDAAGLRHAIEALEAWCGGAGGMEGLC
jgi:broad specificity phosphatase PhoE